jgi:hypothetical protein
MTVLLYAALSIVVVNLFAAVVYTYLHRGVGLAISLIGTILICIGLTYATLNDVPVTKPAPNITTDITTSPTTTPTQNTTVHPSLDPSSISRETPSPAATPSKQSAYTNVRPRHAEKKAPVHRHHFDDREKELQKEQRGTDPGAGGCDDIAAGGCK